MDQLVSIVTYFAIISVAAERLTEIVKKSLLDKYFSNPVIYQAISGVFGAAMYYVSPVNLGLLQLPLWASVIVAGLAVSGGSGFWNTILSTLSEVKTKVKLDNTVAKNEQATKT